MISKKLLVAVATSAAVAGAAIVPHGGAGASAAVGAQAPSVPPTINAKTDPAAAAVLVNKWCQTASDCKFTVTDGPTVAYSAPRTIGDALYNCGPTYAEDSVEITDERSNSITMEESLMGSVKLGLLTQEAEATTKQFEKVSTSQTLAQVVKVPPGSKGWIDTQVPTASVNGELSNGVHFQVTNVELSYPGYNNGSLQNVFTTSVHTDMDAADRHTRCDSLPALTLPHVALGAAPGDFPVALCATGRSSQAGRKGRRTRRCTTRLVGSASAALAISTGTKVALARGHTIYAAGADGKNGVVLQARRKVRRGKYTLLLNRPHHFMIMQVTLR